jgi:N utilization substance protein B
MKINRKREREIIMLSLYSFELTNNDPLEIINYTLNEFGIAEESDYIKDNVLQVIENKPKIDEIISRNLTNYGIDRLAFVDLQIIRFATFELMQGEAAAISINEAVELAKKYSDLDDGKASSFINSVLDKIKKDLAE